jgi:RNA polymerase sigma-70 factor (ECF subfamily)
MTGSLADAEDVVQDAYLRFQSVDVTEVNTPRAYLARLVTRLCLDQMKSARARREKYVGPWLPEPVLDGAQITTPEMTELAHDVSVALLLALERLSPLERAAFLLHDVFELDYAEVALALQREPAACRKLSQRARQHVQAERPRYRPSPAESERLVTAFLSAANSGHPTALRRMLAEDAVLYSDGGGRVAAATKPIVGAEAITRFLLGLMKKFAPDPKSVRTAEINGDLGVVVYEGSTLVQTTTFEIESGKIKAIYSVRNPDKLRAG